MSNKCTICGKNVSKTMSIEKKHISDSDEVICMNCMKEIDPIAYLFILKTIEKQLRLQNRKKSLRELMHSIKETDSLPTVKTA